MFTNKVELYTNNLRIDTGFYFIMRRGRLGIEVTSQTQAIQSIAVKPIVAGHLCGSVMGS